MPLFQYYFLSEFRKKKKGSIEADSLRDAKEKLWKEQIDVLKVVPQRTNFFMRSRVKKSSLINFSKQLHLLLGSGVPLYESLLLILEQYKATFLEPIISFLAEKIRQGVSLSSGLASFPDIFTDFYRAMIISGETVGDIEEALHYNIDLLEKEEKLKKKLLSSLTYPCILFCFSLLVISSFLLFVIPSLKVVFQEFSINLVTRVVFLVSDFVCSYIYFLLFGLFGLILSTFFLLRWEKTKVYCENRILSIPFFKHFIIKFVMGKFTRLLGTLLKGGIPLVEALKISKVGIYPKIFQDKINQIEIAVTAGSSLSREFKRHTIFPKLLIEMTAIGEESGRLSSVFSQVADIYDAEIKKSLEILVTWAQPVILIILGGIIGLIMLAILMPLTGNYGIGSF